MAGHETSTPTARRGFWVQLALAAAVVLLGCANNISKQVAAKPLSRYTYILGLSTAVAYVPLYCGVLWVLVLTGIVPRSQLQFTWTSRGGSWPPVVFFGVAALGDTLGDVIGMICTPYVAGPVHSLLSNCTPIFIALLSILLLRKRYSLAQCLGLLGVLTAVVIGVLPSFIVRSRTTSSTDPFYASVLAGSCVFNAISFVVKEFVFARYALWLLSEGSSDTGGLHIFVVNSHAAAFQLPLTLLSVPLNQVLGQTHGEDIFTYVREAFQCAFNNQGGACGPHTVGGDVALNCVLVYVVMNILWNLAVLSSVKHSGALPTFIALKAIYPVSTLLFALVDWPLLGRTPLHWLVWVSIAVMLPSIAVFQWASYQQDIRAKKHPTLATCCWPLFSNRRSGTAEEQGLFPGSEMPLAAAAGS